MTNDHETCWDILEHLRDVFAQLPQRTSAARAVLLLRKVGVNLTLEMCGKSAAFARSRERWLRGIGGFGLDLLFTRSWNRIFSGEPQLKLRVAYAGLLGTASEARPSQLDHHQFQILDTSLALDDHFAERPGIHLFKISLPGAGQNHEQSMP